jgi:glutathione S-transferase
LAPAIFPLFWGLIRTPPEEQDPVALEQARQKLIELWTVLDGQLQSRPYAGGDNLTLADIALGNSIYRWFNFPIERPELSALRAWYDRLSARPAFQEHLAKPLK